MVNNTLVLVNPKIMVVTSACRVEIIYVHLHVI